MPITILGGDIATSTGFCWMEPSANPSDWRCLAAQCEGDNAEEKAGDLAIFLAQEIGKLKPDFAALEMPQRSVKQFAKKVRDPRSGEETTKETINPNALQLSALAGAVVAVLDIHGVPWGLVAPGTWRSAYFGKGFQPPQVFNKRDKKWENDWKAAAIALARRLGVKLPATVKAQEDASEAIGIASAWQSCTFIPKRHQAAFLALRTRAGLRAAA